VRLPPIDLGIHVLVFPFPVIIQIIHGLFHSIFLEGSIDVGELDFEHGLDFFESITFLFQNAGHEVDQVAFGTHNRSLHGSVIP